MLKHQWGGGVTGTASMPTIPALRKLRLEDLEVEFKDSYMKSGVKQPTTTKSVDLKIYMEIQVTSKSQSNLGSKRTQRTHISPCKSSTKKLQ